MAYKWHLLSLRPRMLKDYVLYLLVMMTSYPLAAKPDPPTSDSYFFAIPAQPLGLALENFSRATGLAVMLDSRYADRPSEGLAGRYPPETALGYLLRYTGLKARWYPASRAYGIVAEVRSLAAIAPSPTAIAGVLDRGNNFFAYVGYVQKRLLGRLCQAPQIRPGAYRLAMQLWIGGQGEVRRVHILSSTGNEQRDEEILKAVQGFHLGLIPAKEMPQPMTILLQPDQSDGAQSCLGPSKAGG